MNGKYKINIIVENIDSGNILGKRECDDFLKLNDVIKNIPNWINKYDELYFFKCDKCNRIFHIKELSSPEDDNSKYICQECLDKLFSGEITL